MPILCFCTVGMRLSHDYLMPNKFLQIIALFLPLPSFKLFLNLFGTHVMTFQGQELCIAFTFQQQ